MDIERIRAVGPGNPIHQAAAGRNAVDLIGR
jgi:hypothetical protein